MIGGYYARELGERLGLSESTPWEDDTTMALPARSRPIEVTANHLWMDRLIRDAAFAHNPSLRQFSIDSLIGDAISPWRLYKSGLAGSRSLQMAASASRRAEYIL